MTDDKVINVNFKQKEELIWCCPSCEGQRFWVCIGGELQCASCSCKWDIPDEILEKYKD